MFNIVRFIPLILLGGAFLGVRASGDYVIFASWGIGETVAAGTAVLLLIPHVCKDYHFAPRIDLRLVHKMGRYVFANYVAELLWCSSYMLLPMVVLVMLDKPSIADFASRLASRGAYSHHDSPLYLNSPLRRGISG